MIKHAVRVIALVGIATLFGAARADVIDLPPYEPPIKLPPYEPPIKLKSPVRILPDIKPIGFDGKPTEILSEKELSNLLGYEVLAKVKKDVDFSREKVLLVTWTGSSSSHLTFDVLEIKGKTRVSAWVETPLIALTDNRMHGALLVMPKDAVWTFGSGPILRPLETAK